MSKVKAYAIHTIIRREGDKKITVPASTEQAISLFDVGKDEFDKLQALGAVREASKEEIALAKARSNDVSDAPTNYEKAVALKDEKSEALKDDKAPASGAADDPKGAPKGASVKDTKKSETKDDEI